MSKNIMIVVAAVVVIGGGYYYFNSNKGANVQAPDGVTDTSKTADATAAGQNKKMAFADFIKQGGAYKCTVNQSVAGVETQGVTYIDGGMIRGEYNTKVQGMNITSTMIVRDGYTYSWSSMMPNTGYKVKAAASTPGNPGAAASASYSFNAEQIGDYSCEPWTVDASKFALPAGVTFKEMGTQ